MRSRLIPRHQDRVTGDVYECDCGEPTIEARNAYFIGGAIGHKFNAPLNGVSTARFVRYLTD
jgi:hypothetical protein